MKINYEKLLKLDSEILEAFGIIVQEFPIVGKVIIENFDDGTFEIKKSCNSKEVFNFEYSYTSAGVYQFCIYLQRKLMFVYHAGEWENIYSLLECNWNTGEGLCCGNTKYSNFEDCVKNRYCDYPDNYVSGSKIDNIITICEMTENIEKIKPRLLK